MSYFIVTGAKGFIGASMARYLSGLGKTVIGLGHGAIPVGSLAQFGLTDWSNGDIDHTNLQAIARRHGKPEALFHFAGGSTVGNSLANPLEDFNRTVTTAANLLEWVRLESPHSTVCVVSSAAVYGQQTDLAKIPEQTPLAPFSPYGSHKAMMEQLAISYGRNFGLRVSICRLFSVYGAGLQKQLVYDLCQKCRTATESGYSTIELGGTGNELRDWIHVGDVCRVLDLVSKQANSDCPILNGGTGKGTSVRDIAELVIGAFGLEASTRFSGESRTGDPTSLVADISMASKVGYHASIDVEAGIHSVVTDFRSANRL